MTFYCQCGHSWTSSTSLLPTLSEETWANRQGHYLQECKVSEEKKTFKNPNAVYMSTSRYWWVAGNETTRFPESEWDMEVAFTKKKFVPVHYMSPESGNAYLAKSGESADSMRGLGWKRVNVTDREEQ